MLSRHPNPEILVEYTSGILSTAPSIAVTTHLQFCPSCRSAVDSLNQVAGDLLTQADATPVSDDLLQKVLEGINNISHQSKPKSSSVTKRIDNVGEALPQFVQRLLPEGDLRWNYLSPSLRVANISVGEDKYELALHRISAGGKAPKHGHKGQEITVVLTGTFSDEEGIYQPGDFVVREPGDIHRPIAAQNQECICLSVLAAPIQLTGIYQLANPFLSFTPS